MVTLPTPCALRALELGRSPKATFHSDRAQFRLNHSCKKSPKDSTCLIKAFIITNQQYKACAFPLGDLEAGSEKGPLCRLPAEHSSGPLG